MYVYMEMLAFLFLMVAQCSLISRILNIDPSGISRKSLILYVIAFFTQSLYETDDENIRTVTILGRSFVAIFGLMLVFLAYRKYTSADFRTDSFSREQIVLLLIAVTAIAYVNSEPDNFCYTFGVCLEALAIVPQSLIFDVEHNHVHNYIFLLIVYKLFQILSTGLRKPMNRMLMTASICQIVLYVDWLLNRRNIAPIKPEVNELQNFS